MVSCSGSTSVWVRIGLLAAGLLIATGLSWGGMAIAAGSDRHMWGTAGLAYTFGLRHGLDADHITAVDNVTRKLVADGQNSVLVGMWFSLGHCSLVIIACLILFSISQSLEDTDSPAMNVLDIVGATLASSFLLLIGLMNLLILIQIGRQIRKLRREKLYVEQTWDEATSKGLVAYCAKPLYKIVDRPWKMLIIGVVFGFGFDTVVSVTVLTTTATSTMDATLFQGFMLSLVFTCGLVALDSADGVLMLLTYSWAALSPVRKVYFNFLITAIAVTAAFFVGLVILLQLIADHTGCQNAFCDGVHAVGEHFEYIGLGLVVAFVLAWAGGYLYYNYGGLLDLEKEVKVVDKLGRPAFDENGLRIVYSLDPNDIPDEAKDAYQMVENDSASTGSSDLIEAQPLEYDGNLTPVAAQYTEVPAVSLETEVNQLDESQTGVEAATQLEERRISLCGAKELPINNETQIITEQQCASPNNSRDKGTEGTINRFSINDADAPSQTVDASCACAQNSDRQPSQEQLGHSELSKKLVASGDEVPKHTCKYEEPLITPSAGHANSIIAQPLTEDAM